MIKGRSTRGRGKVAALVLLTENSQRLAQRIAGPGYPGRTCMSLGWGLLRKHMPSSCLKGGVLRMARVCGKRRLFFLLLDVV